MKQHADNPKTTQHSGRGGCNGHDVAQAAIAGAAGMAVTPPAYGIDFLDMAQDQAQTGGALTVQRRADIGTAGADDSATHAANHTGLPDRLKTGIESLSGISMDHVKVHYNSARPAQLQAHAYTQGSQIHVAPGQERHIPHEAWHVVQQAQGRVKPTMQMKRNRHDATFINDDTTLEHEADVMGVRAWQHTVKKSAQDHQAEVATKTDTTPALLSNTASQSGTVQLVAAAPAKGNAAQYDNAVLEHTAGTIASTSAEVKVTAADKNVHSAPVPPANTVYTLQNYGGDYQANGLTTTVSDTGATIVRPYVATKWTAFFCRDRNKGQSLTQTHIIHHSFATNANNNANNIAWANANLNNSAFMGGVLQPRSVANREHEDRASLSVVPFGSGGKKLATHLYDAKYKIRPYNGAWYTTDNTTGAGTSKVAPINMPTVAANTYPGATDIWQLVPGKLCMWYQCIPGYDTARNYAGNIRANMTASYNARVSPQHSNEEITNPAWFDNVGREIAHSYANNFTISTMLYRLALPDSTPYTLGQNRNLEDIVAWEIVGPHNETIHDPSVFSGGMQVQMEYAKAVDPMVANDIQKNAVMELAW
jgi:hypothetical protein